MEISCENRRGSERTSQTPTCLLFNPSSPTCPSHRVPFSLESFLCYVLFVWPGLIISCLRNVELNNIWKKRSWQYYKVLIILIETIRINPIDSTIISSRFGLLEKCKECQENYCNVFAKIWHGRRIIKDNLQQEASSTWSIFRIAFGSRFYREGFI